MQSGKENQILHQSLEVPGVKFKVELPKKEKALLSNAELHLW
jgi:hypothetical protein